MRLPRLVRRVLDPLTDRIPVPVLGGPNRGRLWSLASAGSGYATGRRAADQIRFLRSLIRPGDVVWDVGAHHGYVTLMAAAAVEEAGVVHAFEPGERNAGILERHLRWNGARNATAHRLALGAADGEADFGGGYTSKTQALGRGDERVTVRRGASLVADGDARAPDVMKIDVEGAEAEVLAGVAGILPADARLVIAMHTPEADAACGEVLGDLGFSTFPTGGLVRARSGAHGWPDDPDLVAVGPDGALAPEHRAALSSL